MNPLNTASLTVSSLYETDEKLYFVKIYNHAQPLGNKTEPFYILAVISFFDLHAVPIAQG